MTRADFLEGEFTNPSLWSNYKLIHDAELDRLNVIAIDVGYPHHIRTVSFS